MSNVCRAFTLKVAGTRGEDDGNGDGPRVSDTDRKQHQHTNRRKGKAALRVMEQQGPAPYKKPICQEWETRIRDKVKPSVVTSFIATD